MCMNQSCDVLWIWPDGRAAGMRRFSLVWWTFQIARVCCTGREMPWRLPSGTEISASGGRWVVRSPSVPS